MRFGKGGSGLYNPYGFVEQMRIQSSTGNVGIGTLTPASKLDVAGDINLSGKLQYDGGTVLRIASGTSIALGFSALQNNTGEYNTASGTGALYFNTSGAFNTAIGANALESSRGSDNTATGAFTLALNMTGNNNTAVGQAALANNTSGSNNIAIGVDAANNVCSNYSNNNIHIGSLGSCDDSGTIRIGTPDTQPSSSSRYAFQQ